MEEELPTTLVTMTRERQRTRRLFFFILEAAQASKATEPEKERRVETKSNTAKHSTTPRHWSFWARFSTWNRGGSQNTKTRPRTKNRDIQHRETMARLAQQTMARLVRHRLRHQRVGDAQWDCRRKQPHWHHAWRRARSWIYL